MLGGGKFSHGSTGVAVGPGVGLAVPVGVIVAVDRWVGRTGQAIGTYGVKAGVGVVGERMAGKVKVQATPAVSVARKMTSAAAIAALRLERFEIADINLRTKCMEGKFLCDRGVDEGSSAANVRAEQIRARASAHARVFSRARPTGRPILRNLAHGD